MSDFNEIWHEYLEQYCLQNNEDLKKKQSFLNHVAKYPNWLRPGYHGNQFKNSALLFCAYGFHVSYPPPKYGDNRLFQS